MAWFWVPNVQQLSTQMQVQRGIIPDKCFPTGQWRKLALLSTRNYKVKVHANPNAEVPVRRTECGTDSTRRGMGSWMGAWDGHNSVGSWLGSVIL